MLTLTLSFPVSFFVADVSETKWQSATDSFSNGLLPIFSSFFFGTQRDDDRPPALTFYLSTRKIFFTDFSCFV